MPTAQNNSKMNVRAGIDEAEFRRLWHERMSAEDIAAHFGIEPNSVYNIKKRLRLPSRGRMNKPSLTGQLTPEQDQEFRRLWNDLTPVPDIARALGISEWAVSQARRRLGIPPRSRADKNTMAAARRAREREQKIEEARAEVVTPGCGRCGWEGAPVLLDEAHEAFLRHPCAVAS